MTSKPIMKYLLLLERYTLACFLIGDIPHNVLPYSLEMYRSSAPYRPSSDDVDGFRLWRVDPLKRGHNTMVGLAQSDGHLVESQQGLEINVSLRTDLVSALGSIACIYINGEYGSFGIECSKIIPEKDPIPVVDLSDDESVEGPEGQG
ncbi:hypothetical protein M9H77_02168 [Catharanthus roseus]|uniref:Uncharacterized protein n=1 Tax=Catharanthus roseus TaxID=4058 RepID=A0ACC0C7M9_CATRO|nr:hypothetical protein M9H77_02168 [Catharanthus roseus]